MIPEWSQNGAKIVSQCRAVSDSIDSMRCSNIGIEIDFDFWENRNRIEMTHNRMDTGCSLMDIHNGYPLWTFINGYPYWISIMDSHSGYPPWIPIVDIHYGYP